MHIPPITLKNKNKMIKKVLFLSALCTLSACKSVPDEPYYAQPIVDVGYFGKFDYWDPVKGKNTLSTKTKSARKKLITKNLSVVIFEYEIDSNGNAHNLKLLQTIPDNLITQEDLENSRYAYEKFKPTPQNDGRIPVKVTERLLTTASGALSIPEDTQSIEGHVRSVMAHIKKQKG